MKKLIFLSLATLLCSNLYAEPKVIEISRSMPLYEGTLWASKSDPGHIVDSNFLNDTKEWRSYQKEVDSMSYDNVEVYEDEKLSQKMFYVKESRVLLVIIYKGENGDATMMQKNYFRDKGIYISQSDFDDNGLPCIQEYILKGKPKYVEFCASERTDDKAMWFSL